MYYGSFKSTRVEPSGTVPKIRTHAGGTTDFGKEGHFVGLHNSTEAKIADHDVCILFGIPKQQIFWLEVTVDDTTSVKICNGAENTPDKICGIPVTEEGEIIHE